MKHGKTEANPTGSAGGWGSLKAVARILVHEHVPVRASQALAHQNKPDGFMCVSCSWAKPRDPHAFEFLRKRCQGDRVGFDCPQHRGRFFRASHRRGTGTMA